MAFPSAITNLLHLTRRRSKRIEKDSDRSLNYYPDQSTVIKKELRQLKMERGLNLIKISSPIILIGAGLGCMVARKYKLGSLFVMGLLLQKALEGRVIEPPRDQKDIELEKYALRVERGDFGKLEVIPFK